MHWLLLNSYHSNSVMRCVIAAAEQVRRGCFAAVFTDECVPYRPGVAVGIEPRRFFLATLETIRWLCAAWR
jgi:hypothetical protein